MNFSSVPEILLAFSYPDLRDIKVNNMSVRYLECCHFFFTGKVLPQTIVFSMLEAPFVCQGLFLCMVLWNSVCVWKEYLFLFMFIFLYEGRIIFMFCKSSVFFAVLKSSHCTSARSFSLYGQLVQKLIKCGLIFNLKCNFS